MPLYFATETAKCSQIHAVCYPLQLEVSTRKKPYPINNALHNGCYKRKACEWLHLRGCCIRAYHVDIYWTELGLCFLHVRWPVMGSGPVGLNKPLSREFCLKYLSNPYTINK